MIDALGSAVVTTWWRWLVVAVATITLCSCRAAPPCPAGSQLPGSSAPGGMPTLPVSNHTAPIMPAMMQPGVMHPGMMHPGMLAGYPPISEDCLACGPTPVDCGPCGPVGQPTCCGPCTSYWRARPIGYGEWVCDGGDHDLGVEVSPSWQVFGLGAEDTVAHFDSIDGQTHVQPSNCVCIYAPRFAATRSVARLVANEYVAAPGATIVPEIPVKLEDLQIPTSALQRVPPQGHVVALPPSAYIAPLGEHIVSNNLMPYLSRDSQLPIAILEQLGAVELKQGEMARLAACIDAAITWSSDLGAQVTVKNQEVAVATVDRKAQTVWTAEPEGQPKLRICKVASTQFARPGDIVEFAIRVDNIGTQPVGNVVLLDHLTTRLEYVEGSAQSSVEATFSAVPNESQSVTLRWELLEPLDYDYLRREGENAIVTFKCRVR